MQLLPATKAGRMLPYVFAPREVNVAEGGVVSSAVVMKAKAQVWRYTAIVLIVLLGAGPASAQAFKWWQSDRYKRELGLTGDQTKRLEEIFQAALPTLRANKKALDDAETEFDRIIERGGDAAVMEQVDRVEAARAQLNKARTMMLLKMRRLLTTDQWIKLGALHQQDERDARDHESGKDHKDHDAGKDRSSAK
jgi:Spy/CpxP family protein refolding chaperone